MTQPPQARRTGLREAHKERTRTALVRSALLLFAERGYDTVTVEDICADADVSPRTFFRYFATKDNVLAAPITTLLGIIRATLSEQPSGVTTWDALRQSLLDAAAYVDAHPDDFRRAGQVIRKSPSALASSAEAMMSWEQDMHD